MNIKNPAFKRLLPGKRFRFFAKVTGFVFVLGFLGTAHGDPSSASKMAKMPAAPQAYQFEDYSKTHMVDEVTGDMGLTLPLFTLLSLCYPCSVKRNMLIFSVLRQQGGPQRRVGLPSIESNK